LKLESVNLMKKHTQNTYKYATPLGYMCV